MKYATVVLIIVLLLLPIYMMFAGSLMDIRGVLRMPPALWPREPSLGNYRLLFSNTPIGRWCINTLVISATLVVVSTVSSAMAGYAFATQDKVKWLYWMFLVSLMIPRQMLVIPMYVLMRLLGLSGTGMAAILPAFFFPVGIFLFRNYVETMPDGMMDSARIDGAGDLQMLAHIIVPLATPVVAVLGVSKFIEGLTDYLWQMLVLQDPMRQTVVVGLVTRIMARGSTATFTANVNPIGIQMAAGVVLFLPLLAIFAVFQKSFIDGIMNGGLRE